MPPTRRNPKKDKAARRRRPERPERSEMRRARLSMETVQELMMAAPADALPLVGLAAVWLWNLSEDRAPAAVCADACLTLHYALGEYGVSSRVEAVGLQIEGNGAHTRYGPEEGPRYNPDGSFNGHAVLVVPEAGRFLDPTVQQYREVPSTEMALRPVLCRLPSSVGLGADPIGVDRGDHAVVYYPVPEGQRQAWRGPGHSARAAEFQEAGANLAANVFAMFRMEELRDKIVASPYPRLARLLAALEGVEPIADHHGFRFTDPATGRELRLADVP